MLQKLKNLFIPLRSFDSRSSRRRIYIIPSIAGIILLLLVSATYLLSFVDRNPWLMSVALLGFAWNIISLLLTHRTIAQLNISSDGKIANRSVEFKTGIRVDGEEIPDIPIQGTVRVYIPPNQKSFRVSTFAPTGFYYSWTMQPNKKAESSDLGESVSWRRGNSLARVDWKLWFRRGRFLATASDPNFRLRPIAESQPKIEKTFFNEKNGQVSDASIGALAFSFVVLFALGLLGLQFAPLWTGVLCFLWVGLLSLGFFSREIRRFWGKINFFLSWITFVLVLVSAKKFMEPWMISTAMLSILFIPFVLHFKILATDNMFRRIGGIIAVAVFSNFALYASQSFIAERFQSRRFAYYGVGGDNGTNWGPSLASTSLKSAERFLARGQGIFWVDFTREVQVKYLHGLPYWRENTYNDTRGGLNWSGNVTAADAGIPLFVNLFLPGRDPLQLQREPPASPKTQSACLQAMEEAKVTLEGQTFALPHPFFFVATQNPREVAGTHALPLSQLDRFMMRIKLGYPSVQAEEQLMRRIDGQIELPQLSIVPGIEQHLAATQKVHVSQSIAEFMRK